MAPANSKANYKTYEAQARMVRAIVAAHPEVKWNYKEICACYGSDMTKDALNHRFRKLKPQVEIIRQGLARGLDMKDMACDLNDLPTTKREVDMKDIAKYFGQSTGDGIQFQFRTIKKDADTLRKVEKEGGNVASCLSLGGGTSSAAATPSKPTYRPGGANKRNPFGQPKKISSDEEEGLESHAEDCSERDGTPTKRQRVSNTPRRDAAARAHDTIANATAELQSADSSNEDMPIGSFAAPTIGAAPPSIFGSVDPKQEPMRYSRTSQFRSDPMVSGAIEPGDGRMMPNMPYIRHGNDMYADDGEI